MLHLMAEYMLEGEMQLAVRARGGAEGYDALRRAHKVSYAAWCLLGLDPQTGADVSRPMAADAQAILEGRGRFRKVQVLCFVGTFQSRQLALQLSDGVVG